MPATAPATAGQLIPADVRYGTATAANGCVTIQPTGGQPKVRVDLATTQRMVATAPFGGNGSLMLVSRDLATHSGETPIVFPSGAPVVIQINYADAWVVLTLPSDAPVRLCSAD